MIQVDFGTWNLSLLKVLGHEDHNEHVLRLVGGDLRAVNGDQEVLEPQQAHLQVLKLAQMGFRS